MQQDQFLDVIDRDEAERRFRAVLDLRHCRRRTYPLARGAGSGAGRGCGGAARRAELRSLQCRWLRRPRRGHLRRQRRSAAHRASERRNPRDRHRPEPDRRARHGDRHRHRRRGAARRRCRRHDRVHRRRRRPADGAATGHAGSEHHLRRHRHRPRRNGAAPRRTAHLARNGRAGRAGFGSGVSRPPAACRHHFDGR